MKRLVCVLLVTVMTGVCLNSCLVVSAEELNINSMKMFIVDLQSTSKTPSQTSTDNYTFDSTNMHCDLSGRSGDSYYLAFGTGVGVKQLAGNKDNTIQGSDNLKSDYSVKVRLTEKSKTKGEVTVAPCFAKIAGARNGAWAVRVDFSDNSNITSEVTYKYEIILAKNSTSDEVYFTLDVTAIPPEVIDKTVLEMSTNNTVDVKYTNSVKVTYSGLTRMRKTKKRTYTVNFPNGIELTIPRIVKQKNSCVIGADFETNPDIEDIYTKEAKSLFFVSIAGTMSDKYRLNCPISEAFENDTEQPKCWKDGKAYIYPVNLDELAKKTKLNDKSGLIDFSRAVEGKIEGGNVAFTVDDKAINSENEIYMITLKKLPQTDTKKTSEVKNTKIIKKKK